MKNNSSLSLAQRTLNWAHQRRIPVWFESAVGSTNTVAKEVILDSPFASLYLTSQQTAGRGRGSNTWMDAVGEGQLFSSWVFSVNHAPQPILAPLVGLSVYKCLCKHWHSIFALKAPNDIYVDDKKIAGILIENIQTADRKNRLIIGIGLNVMTAPDLPNAGCLKDNLSVSSIENEWDEFLTDLFFELGLVASLDRAKLSLEERKDLLQALNKFSLLPEPYLEISDEGSLKTASRTIHWSEL